MNNNRIEIVVISVLLFSFIFFLISYSNYDLRKKRGWMGETYSDKKVSEIQRKPVKNMSLFQNHPFYCNTYQAIRMNKKGYPSIDNNFINGNGYHDVYSQLLFQSKSLGVADDISDTRKASGVIVANKKI